MFIIDWFAISNLLYYYHYLLLDRAFYFNIIYSGHYVNVTFSHYVNITMSHYTTPTQMVPLFLMTTLIFMHLIAVYVWWMTIISSNYYYMEMCFTRSKYIVVTFLHRIHVRVFISINAHTLQFHMDMGSLLLKIVQY